jgi:hypothetical protein
LTLSRIEVPSTGRAYAAQEAKLKERVFEESTKHRWRIFIALFCSTSARLKCSGKNSQVGSDAVLNMVVGAFLALIFFGLPLAIIGLFIASTLDRRGGRPPKRIVFSREYSATTTNHGSDRRRRIIYGQSPAGTRASAERRPARIHGD